MDFLISMVAGVFGFSLVLFVLFVIVVFSIKLPPRQDVQ